MKPAGDSARPFGLASATALVVANMIGAGVFTTSGFALADLGDRRFVLAAWAVGGLVALAGAVSYGRLASRIQESGGEYVYLARALHPGVGFVAGWVSLLAGFTGAIAFAARALEAYLLPAASRPEALPSGALAIATIVVFAGLHASFVRSGLRVQNGIVLLKGALLGLFLVVACARFTAGAWPGASVAEADVAFSPVAFAGALVWISLGYSGFNAAVYVAGEVRDAARTVPRALVLGTLVVTALYLALNTVFLWAPEPADIVGREDVAGAAAEALGGAWLTGIVRAVISIALATSVSSMLIAGPRVYAQMARDGLFPQRFAGRADASGISPWAVALQAALAITVVAFSTLQGLLGYLGFTLSLSAAGTVLCLFVLRRRDGEREPPLLAAVALLYVGATLGLAFVAAFDQPLQLAAALLTLASGALVYHFW